MGTRPAPGLGAIIAVVALVITGMVIVGAPATAAIDCDLHPESPLCNGGDPIDPCDSNPGAPGCTEPEPCPPVTKQALGYAVEPAVGTMLHAVSIWTGASDHVSYRWRVDGTVVGTADWYLVRAEDLGKPLVLEATGHATCGSSATASTAPRTVVRGTMNEVAARPQDYSGDVRVGGTVRAIAAEMTGVGQLTTGFRWLLDGTTTVGSGPEYTPGPEDVGRQLALSVTYLRPGYHARVITTPVHPEIQRGVAPTPTRAPGITGSARYTGRLEVVAGAWNRTGNTSYQWLRNGTVIRGATGAVYRPVLADIGKSVAVRETNAAEGYQPGRAISAPVRVARAGKLAHRAGKKAPVVRGKRAVGKTLAVRPTKKKLRGWFTPRAARVRLQWLRDGKPIERATGRSYHVRKADRRHRITVRVRAVRAGYAGGSWVVTAGRIR